jgi:hypothetical protein
MSETDAVSDIGVTKSKGKYTLTGSVVTEMVTLNDKVRTDQGGGLERSDRKRTSIQHNN